MGPVGLQRSVDYGSLDGLVGRLCLSGQHLVRLDGRPMEHQRAVDDVERLHRLDDGDLDLHQHAHLRIRHAVRRDFVRHQGRRGNCCGPERLRCCFG